MKSFLNVKTGALSVAAILIAGGAIFASQQGLLSLGGGAAFEGERSPQNDRIRRLTEAQYNNIILDVFGPTISINGDVEKGRREEGLLEVGNRSATVSAKGMSQFEFLAKDIAGQITNKDNRDTLIPCKPKAYDNWDEECGSAYLVELGDLLFRRPMEEQERAYFVSAARVAANESGDFYTGLQQGVSNLLISPQFVFRWEKTLTSRNGTVSLDAYSRASRLSFFLWNAAPDTHLLKAAESGELMTKTGLKEQVERMLNSPNLERGTRAFFTDMMGFDKFEYLSKDPTIFPKFNGKVRDDAKEQTLRTIIDHLIEREGDYRDLYKTRRTYVSPALGVVYQVPVPVDQLSGLGTGWMPYEFPEDDPRAGILTHASFTTVHSHPGRTSPTLRGKALREMIFCQRVPEPPPGISLAVLQDTSNPNLKTSRDRLRAHNEEPACAGCHKITDPVGLALETLDSDGSMRTSENGVVIDTTGSLDGVDFSTPGEMAVAVRNNPALPACLVSRLYSYAIGKGISGNDRELVAGLNEAFAEANFNFVQMLRTIAADPNFFEVKPTNGMPEEESHQTSADLKNKRKS